MTLDAIRARAGEAGLGVVGALHPGPDDGVPEGIATLILLGPSGPEMWTAFSASPECADGQPHPMDRWSRRIITAMADDLGGEALFPFGGPPWQPFQKWAVRGEGAVSSPVAMQVSQERGLWVSYRGALGLKQKIDLPQAARNSPCDGCPAPCLTACPVDAFGGGSYDVPRCIGHLKDPDVPCRSGCLVRVACPFSVRIDLPCEQRAFHIDAFLRANGGTA